MHTRDKYVRRWLLSGAVLIFAMVVVGGITRLTGSGLSMSDWNLIMGALPPMNETEWMAAFERYKEFPQYRQLNVGMSLQDFKQIFFWEYVHRLMGRILGLVFLVPFIFFWLRGYFSRKMFGRALLLFGLGALQGAMGWVMVKSGLADVPYVSHYRLALHLLLAVILFSLCIWFALDLTKQRKRRRTDHFQRLRRWALAVGVVFMIQLIWGAFTAGLDAGYIYNTFPLMNGDWQPQNAWALQPLLINVVENPGTVQWMHRIFGTLLCLLVIGLWMRTRISGCRISLTRKSLWLLLLIIMQYALGILTVLYHVPIAAGVLHQAVAMIFWAGWLYYYHELSLPRRYRQT